MKGIKCYVAGEGIGTLVLVRREGAKIGILEQTGPEEWIAFSDPESRTRRIGTLATAVGRKLFPPAEADFNATKGNH